MKTAIVAILVVVLLIVVGALAYNEGQAAGLTEATNIRTQFLQSRGGTTGGATQQGGAAQQGGSSQQGQAARSQASRPIATGVVKSVSGDMLELTQQDGTTVTVTFSSQTVIQKTVTGTANDLQIGQRVSIQGSQTNTGDTATVIQITQPN